MLSCLLLLSLSWAVTLPGIVASLRRIVSDSASRPSLRIASANAASLLVQSGVPLGLVNWPGVQLQGAVLCDGFFGGANLRGANLSYSRLVSCDVLLCAGFMIDMGLDRHLELPR